MTALEGEFWPRPMHVSITDGKRQVQFDTPSDMLDYLNRHPEVAERHWGWYWTDLPLRDDLEVRVSQLEDNARYRAE